MKMFKCRDVVITGNARTGVHLNVQLMDEHEKASAYVGDRVTTSQVKLIDLDRKLAITVTGSIYWWE